MLQEIPKIYLFYIKICEQNLISWMYFLKYQELYQAKKCITSAIVSDNLRILHLHHLLDKVSTLRAILVSFEKKYYIFQKIFVCSTTFATCDFSIVWHNIIPTNLELYGSTTINKQLTKCKQTTESSNFFVSESEIWTEEKLEYPSAVSLQRKIGNQKPHTFRYVKIKM